MPSQETLERYRHMMPGERLAPSLRRWAGPLGVEAKLDEVLAACE